MILVSIQFLYDGPELGSTGQQVLKWTARQAKNVILAKQVTANDSSYALAA